jgi:hypothetical protein
VIHPDDAAKLERLTLKPILGERQDAATTPPVKSQKAARRQDAATETTFSRDEIERKLYLTLDEAEFLSGLSRKHLERQRDAGILPCFMDGNWWKVRRIDLERYDAATGTMATWPFAGTIPALPNYPPTPWAIPDARQAPTHTWRAVAAGRRFNKPAAKRNPTSGGDSRSWGALGGRGKPQRTENVKMW